MYTVQISAGYLLMLISMTYHAVLFVGVVLGRAVQVEPMKFML
jgi:hypothetical protein